MGTKMAPSYANIFMESLERLFLDSETLQPTIWKLYIDDILCVQSGSRESQETFLHRLNSCYPTINFPSLVPRLSPQKNRERREPGNIRGKSCPLPAPWSGATNQINCIPDMHMYVTLFLLIIQLIMVPFCEWYGVTHAERHLMCTVEVHDVARAQPMPGHSTGTLRLRVASYPGPA